MRVEGRPATLGETKEDLENLLAMWWESAVSRGIDDARLSELQHAIGLLEESEDAPAFLQKCRAQRAG